MSQYAHLSARDEQLEAALILLPPKVEIKGEANDVRKAFKERFFAALKRNQGNSQQTQHPDSEEAKFTVEDKSVPVSDSVNIRARITTPTSVDANATYPLLFWMHGGGFFLGSPEMDDSLQPTVVKLQVVLISVDYRLAPEFPFPTGLNDSYAALKWALENAAALKIDPSKGVLVGGASSGANFAGAIALRARDDPFFKQPGFSVTGQVLRVPSVVHPGADIPEEYKKELLSMEQNKDVPILNKSDILQIIEYYQAPPNDPDISILLAPSHSGLPPAFFQIAGYDTLRDEGILYEKVLKESGVKTKIEIYPGVQHGGQSPFPHLPVATKWANDFDKGLEWLLHDS